MNELTHLDLFSGIGGFALAAKWAGFRTVGFAEIKPWASAVLKGRYPGPNAGNVRDRANFAQFRGVTVCSAGYPCPPDSVAGLRRGEKDHRWLWPATRDILQDLGATWFIGENVFGHVSMGLDTVLTDLESLGYAAQSFVIPACAVGAWHDRKRVWIIAARLGAGDVPSDAANALRPRCEELDLATITTGKAEGDNWHAPIGPSALRFPAWDSDFASVLRMANGLPLGLDRTERCARIDALGNAIVPQIAEKFFRFIAQIETAPAASR